MKRRDLIRHLERHGCEFLREGAATPFMSTVTQERLPQYHAIEKYLNFWHARFVKTSTFLFHEKEQRFQQRVGGYRRPGATSTSTLTLVP